MPNIKLKLLWLIALFITVALIILVATRAWADDQPQSKEVVVDGVKGMWFPMPTAKRMLADLTRCQGRANELDLTQQRLSLEKTRTELLEENLVTSEKISETWKTLAEDQAKRLIAKDPWWKSPYLWSTVGFVLGSGITVGVTAAVSAVK